MLWVKDMKRAQVSVEVPTGTTAAQLNVKLLNALERQDMRKEQTKIDESFHDHKFNNVLKGQSQ